MDSMGPIILGILEVQVLINAQRFRRKVSDTLHGSFMANSLRSESWGCKWCGPGQLLQRGTPSSRNLPGPQNAKTKTTLCLILRILSFWDFGPLFWARVEVQVVPKPVRDMVFKPEVLNDKVARPVSLM